MSPKDWRALCAERKQKQIDSIPQDWIIQVPSDKHCNVLDIPEKCGLLSARELAITNTTDVDTLLNKLATAVWSSVEVTLAFYKRAIIAHQLVRTCRYRSYGSDIQRASRVNRLTVSPKYLLSVLSPEPEQWMTISRERAISLVRCTDCQYRSKINFA